MKKLIMTYCFLVSVFFTVAQEPFVELEIAPLQVEVGEPVSVTLKTNVEGNVQIDLPDVFEQSGARHSGMSSSVNYIGGKRTVERYSFQKFTGYFTEKGEFTFGPAKITVDGKEITSSSFSVRVEKAENMISENPSNNMHQAVFGIIQQSKNEVYLGEPFLVEAKVFSQIDILQVENFMPSQLQGSAENITLDQAKRIKQDIEVVDNKQVYTFRMGKSLIFPEQSGTFEISPFELGIYYSDPRSLFPERTKIRSNESKIRVKPLPDNAPAQFDGAVGQFAIRVSHNQKEIQQGKVLPIYVRIHGVGNLHHIDAVTINLPNGIMMYGDPEISDSTIYTSNGIEGYREFIYYLQPEEHGVQKISPIEFAFFNPETEEYQLVKTKPITLNVTPDESLKTSVKVIEKEEQEETVVVSTSEWSSFVTEQDKKRGETTLFEGAKGWLVGAPILMAFLFIIGVRWRAEKRPHIQVKQQIKKAFEQTNEIIDSAKNKDLGDVDFYRLLEDSFFEFIAVKQEIPKGKVKTFFTINENLSCLTESQKQYLSMFLTIGDTINYSGGLEQSIEREKMAKQLKAIIHSFYQKQV